MKILVLRGGFFTSYNSGSAARSAQRYRYYLAYRYITFGTRLILGV